MEHQGNVVTKGMNKGEEIFLNYYLYAYLQPQ